MPLLSHCSILNQTFLQELHTNVGLTTTTSTLMSQNPLLSLCLCNKSQNIFWIQSPQNRTELHIHSSPFLLPKFPSALSISPCAANSQILRKFQMPCSPIAEFSTKPSYKNCPKRMLDSPQPHQHSCPKITLLLWLCSKVTKRFPKIISTKPYQNDIPVLVCLREKEWELMKLWVELAAP